MHIKVTTGVVGHPVSEKGRVQGKRVEALHGACGSATCKVLRPNSPALERETALVKSSSQRRDSPLQQTE